MFFHSVLHSFINVKYLSRKESLLQLFIQLILNSSKSSFNNVHKFAQTTLRSRKRKHRSHEPIFYTCILDLCLLPRKKLRQFPCLYLFLSLFLPFFRYLSLYFLYIFCIGFFLYLSHSIYFFSFSLLLYCFLFLPLLSLSPSILIVFFSFYIFLSSCFSISFSFVLSLSLCSFCLFSYFMTISLISHHLPLLFLQSFFSLCLCYVILWLCPMLFLTSYAFIPFISLYLARSLSFYLSPKSILLFPVLFLLSFFLCFLPLLYTTVVLAQILSCLPT